MPSLGDRPTLDDLQRYVGELEDERGFASQSVRDKCLLLGEETGELFKSVRRAEGMAIDEEACVRDVAHELVDILIYVCAIANRYGLRLEDAFRAKETINANRRWTVDRSSEPS